MIHPQGALSAIASQPSAFSPRGPHWRGPLNHPLLSQTAVETLRGKLVSERSLVHCVFASASLLLLRAPPPWNSPPFLLKNLETTFLSSPVQESFLQEAFPNLSCPSSCFPSFCASSAFTHTVLSYKVMWSSVIVH